MYWTIIIKILAPLFGQILSAFLIPFAQKEVKDVLSKILPITEHWVKSLETTGLPGAEKAKQVALNVQTAVTQAKIDGVTKGIIETAIQLAWLKLGLNKVTPAPIEPKA